MTPKQAIEKAAAFIKRIAYDKKLHYAAGALTWLLLYFVVEGIVWAWIAWLT